MIALPLWLLFTLPLFSSLPLNPRSEIIIEDESEQPVIFLDSSNCTQLRCEWFLEGQQWYSKIFCGRLTIYFPWVEDLAKSDNEYLALLQTLAPANEFKILNRVEPGRKKKLICVDAVKYYRGVSDYEKIMGQRYDPHIAPEDRPKLRC